MDGTERGPRGEERAEVRVGRRGRRPSFERRVEQIDRIVRQLEKQHPDWVEYFRETLGAEGAVTKMFPEPELMQQFEETESFRHIERTLTRLRQEKSRRPGGETTKVITVRIPESLHEALRVQAEERKISVNKLCITKLLKIVTDDETVAQAEEAPPKKSRRSVPPGLEKPLDRPEGDHE